MQFKRKAKGSNQYQNIWRLNTYGNEKKVAKKRVGFMQWHWFWKLVVIFALAMGILAIFSYFVDKSLNAPIVSPVADAQEVDPTVKITMGHVTTSQMDIIKMIVAEFEDQGSATVATAIRIANCESKFNESAEHVNNNGSTDFGVFQINSIHGYSTYKLLAAAENIKIAKAMFIKNGHSWNAWSCK